MPRPVAVAAVLLVLAGPALAQQRRSAPPGAEGDRARPAQPAVLPDVAPDAARPFVGVWQGEFRPGDGESVPMALVVEFLNGQYHSYAFINNNGPIPPLQVAVQGDTLRWETRNSGGGFLVYTGRLEGRTTVQGTLTFRDLPFEPRPGRPTFVLRRRTAAGS